MDFRTFRRLFHRDFALLYSGQAISLIGDGMFFIAVAFAVLEITDDSPLALGIVYAAGAVPTIAFVLVGGVWADRLERRRVMLSADLARMAIQLVMAVLLLTGNAELWHMIALQGLYGAAQAFFGPASTGMLPQILEPEELLHANGLMGATRNGMSLLGAAIGGVLIEWFGPGTVIGLDAATFAVSALCLLAMHPKPIAAEPGEPFLQQLADGFRELRRHRWLWLAVLNASLFLMLYVAPLEVIGPLVAKRELGGADVWGFAMAAFSLGAMIGGVGAAALRLRRPIVVSGILFLITGLTPLLLAFAAPWPAIAASLGVEGLAVGVFLAVWESEMQRQIPNELLSRVSAWDWLGSLAGMPIGFALGGVIAETTGTDVTLYVMAAAGVLLAVWMLVSRDVRRIGAAHRNEANAPAPAGTPRTG